MERSFQTLQRGAETAGILPRSLSKVTLSVNRFVCLGRDHSVPHSLIVYLLIALCARHCPSYRERRED